MATHVQFEVEVKDVEYQQLAGKPWLARVYRPGGPGPFPTIVDVHGGAWTMFSTSIADTPSRVADFFMLPSTAAAAEPKRRRLMFRSVASAVAFSLEENQARTRFPFGRPIMYQDLSPFGLLALKT